MRNGVYWRISEKNAIALAEFVVRKNTQNTKVKYEVLNANDNFKQLILCYYPDDTFSDTVKSTEFTHMIQKAYKNADQDEIYVSLNKSAKKHKMLSFLSQDGRLYITLGNDAREDAKEAKIHTNKSDEEATGHQEYCESFELFFKNMLSGCAIFSYINKGDYARDYILEDINELGEIIVGDSKDHLIGKALNQLRMNIEKTNIMDEIKKVAITGETSKSGTYLYDLDGYNNYYELGIFRLCPGKIAVIFRDITSSILTQNETQKSRKRLTSYLENSPYGIFIADVEGKILDANQTMLELGGYTSDEWLGHNVLDFIVRDDLERAKKDLHTVRKDKENFASVYKCLNKQGHIRYWHVNTVKMEGEGFLGFVNDITIRHELEERLRASEFEYRSLFDHAGLSIEYYDTADKIIWMNKAAANIMGSSPEHFAGKSVYDVFPKQKAEMIMKRKTDAIDGCKVTEYEDHVKSDTMDMYILSRYNCINGQDNKLLGVEVIYINITELRKSQLELAKSQKRYSSMIENISDVIMVVKTDGKIAYISPNVFKLFGWDSKEIIGARALGYVHPDDMKKIVPSILASIRDRHVAENFHVRCMSKDGKYRHLSITARNMTHDDNIDGILVNFRDITNMVNLEKEKLKLDSYMRTRQKLDSVGTLASGVAHEINNPINGIINYSQVILDELEDKEHIEKCAQGIIHEAGRVSDIVKNLLDFSRPQKQNFEGKSIKDILDRTIPLFKSTLRHDKISLRLDIPEGLPYVSCLSGQIQQVLMNLITNARDSLNTKYPHGGKEKILTIDARNLQEEGSEFIRLTIEDHGTGIPEKIQERIFDPFFTTKSRDKGSGLGLSISYGIVKEHRGNLTFETKPGEYTKFYLDLPIYKDN